MIIVSYFLYKHRYNYYEDHKFVMKSQITVNKGTQSLQLEVGLPNWSGELFNTYQEEQMTSIPTNTIISTKRGTVGIRSSGYLKSRRTPIPVGTRIISARGTAIRTL
jgi:hypothetical protein